MKVALWAEIRRWHEIEHLSHREIAERLHCSRETVAKALQRLTPPDETARAQRGSLLDPYREKIQAILGRHPALSAVRIWEEIRQGGYTGSVILVRRYVRQLRRVPGRVYQEVTYEPGQAMQVDWGDVGPLRIEGTTRRVSVFVAVLCYSRLCYIEFTLSQRKAEFYRGVCRAIEFFGGSPRRIIFDNLKAAVLNGAGRQACPHPEFLALCGHFCLEPIACARRDPESKGTVEGTVRYVKHNALAGRSEELTGWDDYQRLAIRWRDEVANIRQHRSTGQRPIDRWREEQPHLRALPTLPFDTDEIVSAVASAHARVQFDGNYYSVPVEAARRPVMIRASLSQVRVFHEGREVATHPRSFGRGQKIAHPDHQRQALLARRRERANSLESQFDALGEAARQFHVELRRSPTQTKRHLRRLLELVRLYGRAEVLRAIARANELQTYDAAYVETIVQQERRRRELPSPLPLRPKRQELIDEIDLPPSDPAEYDRLFGIGDWHEGRDLHTKESSTEPDPSPDPPLTLEDDADGSTRRSP
jgi:transposase